MIVAAESRGEVVARLSRLGRHDREAVLSHLTPEERAEVERLIADRAEAEAAEAERKQQIDRQFLGYSPWLASLIETTEHAAPDNLTVPAARAIWDLHSAAIAARAPAVRSGWQGWLDRISDWFAPIGGSKA